MIQDDQPRSNHLRHGSRIERVSGQPVQVPCLTRSGPNASKFEACSVVSTVVQSAGYEYLGTIADSAGNQSQIPRGIQIAGLDVRYTQGRESKLTEPPPSRRVGSILSRPLPKHRRAWISRWRLESGCCIGARHGTLSMHLTLAQHA